MLRQGGTTVSPYPRGNRIIPIALTLRIDDDNSGHQQPYYLFGFDASVHFHARLHSLLLGAGSGSLAVTTHSEERDAIAVPLLDVAQTRRGPDPDPDFDPADMTTIATSSDMADEAVSPKNKSTMGHTMNQTLEVLTNAIDSMEMRADPDAQATVTDFLDFTEYLPSDIVRSLTLIGKLDESYADHSSKLNELTTTWGQLPSLPPEARPPAAELRAQISEHLRRAVMSRLYTHAEAKRMTDNINRHYNRAENILAKLQTMLEKFPSALEEQKSPVTTVKSPQLSRAPKPAASVGEDGQKVRRKRVPRIIVPGEVLAPHELNFDAYTDSDDSSSPEPDTPTRRTPSRTTPGPASRIKLVNKTQKVPKTPKPPGPGPGRPPKPVTATVPGAGPSGTPVVLRPPPENAAPGSEDAPWLQLTAYELAKLRKKMKKNAMWTPSETMIARELKALGRGPEAYRAAKKKAEDEGKPFNSGLPAPVAVDAESGAEVLPEGAISVDTLEDDVSLSNKGMKLNEAKKLKREAMAKQAAEEAEEAERTLAQQAMMMFKADQSIDTANAEKSGAGGNGPNSGSGTSSSAKTRTGNKRKRDTAEPDAGSPEESTATESQGARTTKKVKTETPVPPPNLTPRINAQTRSLTPVPPPSAPQSTTPVPIPRPHQGTTGEASAQPSMSPSAPARAAPASKTPDIPAASLVAATATVTAVPTKPPAELSQPSSAAEPVQSATPITPPARVQPRRETRQGTAKKQQQTQAQHEEPSSPPAQEPQLQLPTLPTQAATPAADAGASRPPTPPEQAAGRRPVSRGNAASQEPGASVATDRLRRSSTARNTPAPEQQPSQRQQPKVVRRKRPAPGIVSTNSSGGNSAVGKRKAAPRKKVRGQKKDKGQVEMEEVDDEGNPIPSDEARYCLCNRVSFGTMIECDNADNCKAEWFHIECVGLSDIPARTTKWYCPECRVLLNIGEKGEVSARGVKK
ncbi:uncharacterized protein DNG_03265 [Cephalotrichum gorgonifer]|uniref:PHD-type domain-containing protein n=1 Tax=Cephalotrichum gorgonifer TaxID=2041049 RepID=A0AAE8MVZ5_9PEZI|nr:uncharacterized protein DNG_03265 [Cephalotrichum gorgonifer]